MSREKKQNQNANQDENIKILNELAQGKEQVKKKNFFSHLRDKIKEQGFRFRGLGGLLDEYRNYKKTKGEVIEKYEAYETVVAGSTDTIEYYILLILSCLVATVGLYQNSPAIIIGAMIVAPLMGPIFGFSASVLWGSRRIIWESFTTLLKGTLLVVAVTCAMTFFIPGIIITQEMIARYNPSLFDILVAICCGFIGAYAFINKRVSAAIPGVAISVALMPPLCTMGIGVGLLNWEMALGALLLYTVNLIGISIAALIVFYLVRLNPKADDKREFNRVKVRALRQFLLSFLILLLIAVPLVYFSVISYSNNIRRDIIYNTLKENIPDADIYSFNIHPGETDIVEAVLLQEKLIVDCDVPALEQKMRDELDKPVKLFVYCIKSLSGSSSNEILLHGLKR